MQETNRDCNLTSAGLGVSDPLMARGQVDACRYSDADVLEGDSMAFKSEF